MYKMLQNIVLIIGKSYFNYFATTENVVHYALSRESRVIIIEKISILSKKIIISNTLFTNIQNIFYIMHCSEKIFSPNIIILH